MQSADRLHYMISREQLPPQSRSAVPIEPQFAISVSTETTDEGEDILEDISDGFEALKAVPVDFFLPGSQVEWKISDTDVSHVTDMSLEKHCTKIN